MGKNETYEEFVEKFKPKKTADDCYTPPKIYEVIKDWACKEYEIDPDNIVRPFWPGRDYEAFEYPEGCVVLDNPPFSMLSKICNFYLENGINFFLFCPTLVSLSGAKIVKRICHVIVDSSIVYENGAKVKTSFVTSFQPEITARTAPDLNRAIREAVEKVTRKEKKQLPKYEYPKNVVTAAMLQRLSKYEVDYRIARNQCVIIRQLDAQKESKKVIYGEGLLLSEKAAAEKAAAEKAAAEKFELSAREKAIIAELSMND